MSSSAGEYRNRLDESVAVSEIDRRHAAEHVEPAFAEPPRAAVTDAAVTDAAVTDAAVTGSGRGDSTLTGPTLTGPPADWGGEPAADHEPGTAIGEGAAATAPVGGSRNGGESTNGTDLGDRDPLIPAERGTDYQSRWRDVQVSFVDEPRSAVSQADALVGDLLDQLADTFRHQRQSLEQAWNADQASTEDLRVALNRYRAFFDRLLSL